MDVYVESGAKRVFAGALEWPGWCRSGRDQAGALEALDACGARYAEVVRGLRPAFHAPASVSELRIVERLPGDATTDFGAPGAAPSADGRPVDAHGLARLQAILEACWGAFDRAVDTATGSELRRGARGGGRELAAIVGHVVGAEAGYLRRLAVKPPVEERGREALEAVRDAVREALARAVHDGLPERGPRGGRVWTVRYHVRRSSWHALDHAWEVEDRMR